MKKALRNTAIFPAARPRGRKSGPTPRPPAATPAAKATKASPASPSGPARALSRIDRAHLLLFTALVACATLPYINILWNGFVYDDDIQAVRNPYVKSFLHLKEIFSTSVWSFTGPVISNYYRPMMTLGYLFCYKLFGQRAYGFHLASLLLHILVVCLVFVLTERLTGDRVCALIAGAWFALHPIHTEAVAWIAAVTDLELTFFFLLTFGFYLTLAKPLAQRPNLTLGAMLGSFVLALLSKEQAIMLPVLATVYEHFYRDDRSETTLLVKLKRYGPLWLAAAAYVLLRIHLLGALAPEETLRELTTWQIILSAVTLVGQYVWKVLWPVRLCAFYVFHPSTSLLDPRVLAGLLALLALAALFIVCWRSGERNIRLASFGIVWFLATLAPVLNARWVGQNVFTERYLYLPSVGIAWLAGLGGSKLWSLAAARPARRRALMFAGLVVCVLFAIRIVIRDRDWNNDFVLFTRTLRVSPDAFIIANNLGLAYWNAGDLEKAESIWRGLLAKHPDNLQMLNNLGFLAKKKHQYPEAVRFFQRAIELDPGTADRHLNLAETFQEMGIPNLAEPEIRAAVLLSPDNIRGRNMLGKLLFAQAHISEAEEQFGASLRAEPNATAYDYLGMISYRRGSIREAEENFRRALNLEPGDSYAHFGLGDICQVSGRQAEALKEYEAGLVNDPTNAQALAAVQQLRRSAR